MLSRGVKPDVMTYNLMMNACLSSNQWDKVVQLFNAQADAINVEPDLISYNAVIVACVYSERTITHDKKHEP